MKRPPVPHPLDIALRDRFARQSGIDPAQLAAWLEWREAPPRAIVDRLVAAFFPLVPPEAFLSDEETLPSSGDNAKIDTGMQMESTQSTTFRGVAPTESTAATKLRAAGRSIAEWAKANGVPYSTARSWFQKGKGGRPVPSRHYESMRAEFGIRRHEWPNGVVKERPRK